MMADAQSATRKSKADAEIERLRILFQARIEERQQVQLSLDRELQKLVTDEVRNGRFESAEALLGSALRHFLIARQYGEAEANKLAALREELLRADAQITDGACADYEPDTLSELFREVETDALRALKETPTENP